MYVYSPRLSGPPPSVGKCSFGGPGQLAHLLALWKDEMDGLQVWILSEGFRIGPS